MSKFKISNKIGQSGFTLIELLVVIAVFAAMGTVVLSILFVTLRASSKSEQLIYLKQNGNTALSQVIRQIRYAKSLDIPSTCPLTPTVPLASIKVTSIVDDVQTEFSCQGNTITSNSESLLDTSKITVSDCSFTCSQPTVSDPPTINFKFKLDINNSGGLVENSASVPFQTSVILRNYSK